MDDCALMHSPPYVVSKKNGELYVHETTVQQTDRFEFQRHPGAKYCGKMKGRTSVNIDTGEVIEMKPVRDDWCENKATRNIDLAREKRRLPKYYKPINLRTIGYYELLPQKPGDTNASTSGGG